MRMFQCHLVGNFFFEGIPNIQLLLTKPNFGISFLHQIWYMYNLPNLVQGQLYQIWYQLQRYPNLQLLLTKPNLNISFLYQIWYTIDTCTNFYTPLIFLILIRILRPCHRLLPSPGAVSVLDSDNMNEEESLLASSLSASCLLVAKALIFLSSFMKRIQSSI